MAGAAAGFFAGVVVCPLDVVKTRLQAQGAMIKLLETSNKPTKVKLKYNGFTGAFKTIIKEEGIRGLYRGLVPITIGYLPTWMIYFTIYEKAKLFYPQFLHNNFGIDAVALNHCVLAMTAGMASSIAVNPIWVVKTRLMIQTGKNKTFFDVPGQVSRTYYKGTFDAFKTMYKEEGIRAFYRGLVPSLFGLIHVGIHFPVYEKLKSILDCNISGDHNTLARLILASSLSKMVASTITYPHEILRTRMQIQPAKRKGPIKEIRLLDSIVKVYRKEGLRGFYAGYATNLARTLPLSAVTLVSFEYFKNYLFELNHIQETHERNE